jgi:hypothetical protein
MKMKKMVLGLLLALSIVGVFATNAPAQVATYNCTIDRIGGDTSSGGAIYATLTASNGAFTRRNFRIPEGRMNQMMALLLTAASNGLTVTISANNSIDDQTERYIRILYYVAD